MPPVIFKHEHPWTGLNALWAETLGDPSIGIAVLDGPVDQSHPSLTTAHLTPVETLASGIAYEGAALEHGTHVASILFGQHEGPVKGVAPHCRGLIVPVFKEGNDHAIAPCSQLDLARGLLQAAQEGVHIINISGGELSPSGTAHPLLADAVRRCAAQGILIIAAAGNEGCDCLHIPGALPTVLAVGAMNAQGEPLPFSNWGQNYQIQGILAPGEAILGARPGGGTVTYSGTSYATAIVSGIAALLLSLQLKQGQKTHPPAVREAILSSAIGCQIPSASDCRRLLAGRLNIRGAMAQITSEGTPMTETKDTQESPEERLPLQREKTPLVPPAVPPDSSQVHAAAGAGSGTPVAENPPPQPTASPPPSVSQENLVNPGAVNPSGTQAAACECGAASAPPQLVFALGQLGFDFGTEARRDSILQHMKEPANPHDPKKLLAYLEENPWDAAAILWTLNLDATPIYGIQGQGAFASEVYLRLREFLKEQSDGEVERVSVPGYLAGSARLSSGQVVPVIGPALRGMYSWNTAALVKAAGGDSPSSEKVQGVANFLRRVYDELRNLGMMPQERALNYAATNAFQVTGVFKEALEEGMDLDTIEVERSPLCRPDSECWDVKLTFFNPKKVFEQARKVYRFTVDVSDVVPVMVGPVRSWFVR